MYILNILKKKKNLIALTSEIIDSERRGYRSA